MPGYLAEQKAATRQRIAYAFVLLGIPLAFYLVVPLFIEGHLYDKATQAEVCQDGNIYPNYVWNMAWKYYPEGCTPKDSARAVSTVTGLMFWGLLFGVPWLAYKVHKEGIPARDLYGNSKKARVTPRG